MNIMPIRFKCPHCDKPLSVKEHLAGKKAACPACKRPITIPAPVATAADVEELAATAFNDAPAAAAPPPETRTISFTCPFCDETVQVSRELSGKQTPCPNMECGRIIKVPLLKEEKPRDWRKMTASGPSVAQRGEAEPEGAWGTATSRGRVSQESLLDADAIPVEREPTTVGQWIKRGVLAVGALLVVVGAWWGVSAYLRTSAQRAALAKVLEAADAGKLGPTLRAELHRAAGEFQVRAQDPAETARDRFAKARAALAELDPKDTALSIERDLLLIEIALAQIELGSADEDQILRKVRLEWSTVLGELASTIRSIQRLELRLHALRQVCWRLFGDRQKELAVALAVQVSRASEDTKTIKKDEEESSETVRSFVESQLLALYLALDQNDRAADTQKEAGERVVRLGQAEGKALQGHFEEARKIALAKGSAELRLEACVAVAAVAVAHNKADEARASVENALQIESDLRKTKQPVPAWLRWQLVQATCRAGLAEQAKPVIEAIMDKTFKSQAQLELVQAELQKSQGAVELTFIDELLKDKDTLAYALAVERLSRKNSERGRSTNDLLEAVSEGFRPFVHAGIALGVQDRSLPRR